jgi:hypothetical protein
VYPTSPFTAQSAQPAIYCTIHYPGLKLNYGEVAHQSDYHTYLKARALTTSARDYIQIRRFKIISILYNLQLNANKPHCLFGHPTPSILVFELQKMAI